jgi:hypothetical protein
MMATAEEESGPEAIVEVAMGFMASKHFFVANEIGLFTALADGPATLEQVAERADVPARTLRIVADAMVALGFLEREENAYRNGAAADAFLSGRGQMNMAPMLRFLNAISYPGWVGLERAVRTDGPVWEALTDEQQAIFSEGVEAITAGAAHALADAYDFGRHQRLLDIGGGTGSFLVAILSAHTALEGTLFELAEVAEIAKRKLAASPVADRVSVTTGSAFEDELPGGHDAVLLANLVHYFLPERNIELVRRVRAAVEPRRAAAPRRFLDRPDAHTAAAGGTHGWGVPLGGRGRRLQRGGDERLARRGRLAPRRKAATRRTAERYRRRGRLGRAVDWPARDPPGWSPPSGSSRNKLTSVRALQGYAEPAVRPRREGPLTAQGHPRAIFKRAIERGNVLIAEMAAREIGNLTLEEALQLVCLYAEAEPAKFERAALRWHARYVTEGKAVSLLKTQLALSALAELRAEEREAATKMLTELVRP